MAKRTRALLVALVVLLAPVGMLAPAAHAGDGFWSQSGCRPDISWYGYPGQGAYYRYNNSYPWWWVGGTFNYSYGRWGWECGMLGGPVGDEFTPSNNAYARQQNFEGGFVYKDGFNYWWVCQYGPSGSCWAAF
jgi:hypothetical protein